MERSEQRRILEALVLSSPEPVPAGRLASAVPEATPSVVQELVRELNDEYQTQERGFEIEHVAGGYQMRTCADLVEYVRALQPRRAVRLSRASLETLAVIAYKQPVTRAEIEHIRGVDAGAVLRSLLERNLVRVAGHREIPGRPMLYATSKRFLEVFGLASLEDLPTLRELDELLPPAEAAEPTGDEEPSAPAETSEEAAHVFGSFQTAYAESDEDEAAADDEDTLFEDTEPRGEPH